MADNMLQITADCAYATVETPYGATKTLLLRGALLKADAPEARHLLASGLAERVGDDAEVGVNADGTLGEAKPAGEQDDAAPRHTPSEGDTADTTAPRAARRNSR